jgi:hypothetical protein
MLEPSSPLMKTHRRQDISVLAIGLLPGIVMQHFSSIKGSGRDETVVTSLKDQLSVNGSDFNKEQ